MTLELRLTLLRDGGQISQETYRRICDAIAWFAAERNVILTEENAAMFVTHIGIALERLSRGESVAALDSTLMNEIAQSTYYADAHDIAAELEKLWDVSFPDNELGFIWLHLCTLLDGEGN